MASYERQKSGVGKIYSANSNDCIVSSCVQCESCKKEQEYHNEKTGMVGTYGIPETSSLTV